MEIRKFIDVSTAHIRQSDVTSLEGLARSGEWSALLEGPCGFFVWTGYHEENAFPDAVREVLKWAREQESLDYVMFDQDGDFIDGLPEYEEE